MNILRRMVFLLLAVACAASLVAGCRRSSAPVEGPQGTLGVAGFFLPQGGREMLAGYLPEERTPVTHKVLVGLDKTLAEQLKETGPATWMGAAAVRQCQEELLAKDNGSPRGNALDHWLAVGECAGVDWLLVPQLTYWRERDGSEVSVRQAASVTLDLFLVNVREKGLGGRYHFEETQLSLSENLLGARKFMRRGGKWITAMELAREGLAQGLEEFGL
ncbi:hypothetical protein [Desulfocurvus sp. DL9XJH121]